MSILYYIMFFILILLSVIVCGFFFLAYLNKREAKRNQDLAEKMMNAKKMSYYEQNP